MQSRWSRAVGRPDESSAPLHMLVKLKAQRLMKTSKSEESLEIFFCPLEFITTVFNFTALMFHDVFLQGHHC